MLRLPFSSAANGIQAVAVLWPFETDAIGILALHAGGKRADDLLLDHAQKSRVLVALVVAVGRGLIDQGADPGMVITD